MAIFKVLELEDAVQTEDKTRLNASKTFVSKTSPAISAVDIKPGLDGSYANVFVASQTQEWYLDWQFDSWSFDIKTGFNDKINFNEGSSELIATLTQGTYTFTSLATEIQTQLNAAGANTYTVLADLVSQKLEISADGGFELLGKTGSSGEANYLVHLGYSVDTGNSTSHESKVVEYSFKVVNIQVTATAVETKDFYIKVYNKYGDRLFSDDKDLVKYETDVLKWVAKGRNTFKDIHRRVQTDILGFLSDKGYVDIYQNAFDKWSFKDLSQINDWATYLALSYIFNDASNQSDDIWAKKSAQYNGLATQSRNKFIKIDIDSDGVVDTDEFLKVHSGNIFLR